ncbi:MAG: ChaN family lipoprotein [Gemmatimonadetes bacterium]|nr:ChaN family lipoprotein [Gemmatimonadota bacterium]
MKRALRLPLVAGLALLAAVPLHAQTGASRRSTRQLASALAAARQGPEAYVLSKFATADVVLLGEWHGIHENLAFLQRLIPLLPRAGVHVIAWEFARRVDQPAIDSLLGAPAWNEARARDITRRFKVDWGFREYVDVLQVIWRVNRDAPAGAVPLRLLALGNAPRWEVLARPEDARDPARWAQVWHGETEADWARVVLDSVVLRGGKILTYTGLNHAFTHFRQPVLDGSAFAGFETRRFGNVLYNRLGSRTFMIVLHGPWPDSTGYGGSLVPPADGAIEAAIRGAGLANVPIGFDIVRTPFADATGRTSVYSRAQHAFRLADLADGYIYLAPMDRLTGVQAIDDFITDELLPEARRTADDVSLRQATLEQFRAVIAEGADLRAALRRRYRPAIDGSAAVRRP